MSVCGHRCVCFVNPDEYTPYFEHAIKSLLLFWMIDTFCEYACLLLSAILIPVGLFSLPARVQLASLKDFNK